MSAVQRGGEGSYLAFTEVSQAPRTPRARGKLKNLVSLRLVIFLPDGWPSHSQPIFCPITVFHQVFMDVNQRCAQDPNSENGCWLNQLPQITVDGIMDMPPCLYTQFHENQTLLRQELIWGCFPFPKMLHKMENWYTKWERKNPVWDLAFQWSKLNPES